MRRMALLWSLVVVLFFVVYVGIGAMGTGLDESLSRNAVLFLPVLLIVLFIGFFSRTLRTAVDPALEAEAAYSLGRYAEAHDLFSRSAQSAPAQPHYRVALAMTLLQLGRLGEADAMLTAVLPKVEGAGLKLLATKKYVRAAVQNTHALVAALSGNASAARRHRQARAALSSTMPRAMTDGLGTLSEAVLACRERRWAEAHRLLRSEEVVYLGGRMGVLGRALTSWCEQQLGHASAPVDRAALYGESDPKELREAWPELAAFVDSTAR